jgi:hypothetical protein
MANAETRVTGEFSTVAVHHLSVARLRGVGAVFCEGDAEDVGPFFEGFGEVGVGEGEVGCSVPAVKLNVSKVMHLGKILGGGLTVTSWDSFPYIQGSSS